MIPSRRGSIEPFHAMAVLRQANQRAAAGHDILHLEIGEPSRRPPEPVIAAARAALERSALGYTESLGLPRLRERISLHYRERHGLGVAPERIVVTTGSSGAFLLAYLGAFDANQEVMLTTPGYPAYRNTLHALDLVPRLVASGPETGYQPSVELLRRQERSPDGLIVANPSNPSGSMLSRKGLADLVHHCTGEGIRLVCDEVYHGIAYERPAVSALAFSDEVLVVNSFSKYFAMTGWRLGWMVVPPGLLDAIERLAQNLFISPPALPQYAALAAFDCAAELDAEVRRYKKNRDILLEELPKAGIGRFAPADGAFYLYADISDIAASSADFCRALLEEAGVAITPGVDFDPERGHRTVRFSYAGKTEHMIEAARRIAAWRGKKAASRALGAMD